MEDSTDIPDNNPFPMYRAKNFYAQKFLMLDSHGNLTGREFAVIYSTVLDRFFYSSLCLRDSSQSPWEQIINICPKEYTLLDSEKVKYLSRLKGVRIDKNIIVGLLSEYKRQLSRSGEIQIYPFAGLASR